MLGRHSRDEKSEDLNSLCLPPPPPLPSPQENFLNSGRKWSRWLRSPETTNQCDTIGDVRRYSGQPHGVGPAGKSALSLGLQALTRRNAGLCDRGPWRRLADLSSVLPRRGQEIPMFGSLEPLRRPAQRGLWQELQPDERKSPARLLAPARVRWGSPQVKTTFSLGRGHRRPRGGRGRSPGPCGRRSARTGDRDRRSAGTRSRSAHGNQSSGPKRKRWCAHTLAVWIG
jgi:hypothetical protein